MRSKVWCDEKFYKVLKFWRHLNKAKATRGFGRRFCTFVGSNLSWPSSFIIENELSWGQFLESLDMLDVERLDMLDVERLEILFSVCFAVRSSSCSSQAIPNGNPAGPTRCYMYGWKRSGKLQNCSCFFLSEMGTGKADGKPRPVLRDSGNWI